MSVHSALTRSIPSELVERLEVAEAGSRELDREIMGLFYRMGERVIGIECDCCPHGRHVTPVWVDPLTDEWKTTALHGYDITTSLDAALALAERVLPGWWWSVSSERIGEPEPRPFASGWLSDGKTGALKTARAPTPALALCVAILKATTASSVGTQGEARSEQSTPGEGEAG